MFGMFKLLKENAELKLKLKKYEEYFSGIKEIKRSGFTDMGYNRIREWLEENNALIIKDKSSDCFKKDMIHFIFKLPKENKDA